ncbi:uncharacterized protein LOC113238896 [Hyposmocoma kahamanoa]|uniref:uncharacterized protein LOC113238896 n=1 Tax=Hyposmocoma kahamanoa TaxID=1477025 RepID=UPI000E6D6678|nr:uncharacterized protein LOC113238896 [Hyposmocoma kahamanoa]
MTPEKHKEIETFVDKVTAFLAKLAEEFDEFDIRHVNFDIEGLGDEEEEKETILQVTINDCATIAEKEAEEDREELKYKEQVKKELIEEQKKGNKIEETHKETSERKLNNYTALKKQNSNSNTVVASKEQTSQAKTIDSHSTTQVQKDTYGCSSNGHETMPHAKPTIVYLNLSENGQEMLNILEKKRGKRPVVVVLEQDNGKRRILMPSRR